ncbi:MAG: ABC transporter ATP-binding protein [Candidatus Bathyarchaeia archaeon]
MTDYLVETRDVYKWFPIKGGILGKTVAHVKAVEGVSLGIKKGETVGLVGESGCGKTTIARLIMRLLDTTKGQLYFDGTEITKLKGRKLKPFRRKMQIVFQDPYASLDPRQTVGSALTEPMRIHQIVRTRGEAYDEAKRLIRIVGLNPDHLARFPHEFSGGQRQRIAIARALAVEPQFVMLDEPTSSLDVSVQAQILELLKDLQKEFDLTYLFISHNLSVIRYMCHRIMVMYLGKIVEEADTLGVYERPMHPYTYALLAAAPIPDPDQRKGTPVLEGDVPSPINIPSGCRFRTRCQFATNLCAETEPELEENEAGHLVRCHYRIDFLSKKVAERPMITHESA